MNKYKCILCGTKYNGWGNNPEPLSSSLTKCCNKCDIILVVSARLLNHTSLRQHLHFIDAMKTELPDDVKDHVEQVNEYMEMCDDDKNDTTCYTCDDSEDWEYVEHMEPEEPYQDSMTFGEIYLKVTKAYEYAMENELYESVPFLIKRLKELEDGTH